METSDDVIIAEAQEEEVKENPSIFMPRRSGRDKAVLSVDFVKKYILYAKARW